MLVTPSRDRFQQRKVEERVELQATGGPRPLCRSLDIWKRGKYWFAPDRRIVLLTVFRKTRMHETAQVSRAVVARKVCADEHGPAHTTYSRGEEGEKR